MKGRISKRTVEALKPGQIITDTDTIGFIARCLPSGVVTYGFQYRSADGRRPWLRLGKPGRITPDQARGLAEQHADLIGNKRDPAAEQKRMDLTTVNSVLDNYMKRDVRHRRLRSADTIESAFDRLVRPVIGTRSIYDLKKSDIANMLDGIADSSGPTMADRTLAYVRAAFRWHANRDDDFTPPMVKPRLKPKERKRKRILEEEEIRDLWRALDLLTPGEDVPACYPGFVRALIFTAQRRTNVSHMSREEIASDKWIIPAERMKHKEDHLVPITPAFQKLIGNREGFPFSNDDGKTPFSGYSKAKAALDKKINELRKSENRKPMKHWVLHDLRRTSRTIMSAYTTPDHAERVIGHIIPGMRGTYDVFEYAAEKRTALEKLAAHIEGVVG
jgi:integrase